MADLGNFCRGQNLRLPGNYGKPRFSDGPWHLGKGFQPPSKSCRCWGDWPGAASEQGLMFHGMTAAAPGYGATLELFPCKICVIVK